MESRILALGRELFAAADAGAAAPLSRAWLHDRGMAWSMADPQLQSHLFRFIDALPGLRGDMAIVRQLGEYLGPVADRLPWLLRRVLKSLPAAPAAPVAWAVRRAASELAGRFMLGAEPMRISAAVAALHQHGFACTVDWLGETVLTESEADAYLAAYQRLLPALVVTTAAWPAAPAPHVNLSIKLSALTSRFEPADPRGTSRRVRECLRPLLRAARAAGAVINVDMEHHAFRDTTLAIVGDLAEEEEFRTWDGLGIAVQAYLRSCADDLAQLAAIARRRGAPLWVRLVKGAYWDHETALACQRDWTAPVFTDKAATDANFEAQSRWLIDRHELLRPALAGHNVRSLAHALAYREARGLAAGRVEFQMLHGMAEPLARALVARGEQVRVYCPVGELLPGIAYLVRRLLENTSSQGFVRAGFIEHAVRDQLLAPPRPAPAASPPHRKRGGDPMFSNHPPADFSRADARLAMTQALAALTSAVCRAGSRSDRWLISTDPSCRAREVGRATVCTAADAQKMLDTAAAALPVWRATPWAERCACLQRAAERMAADRWQLAALLVREVGKNWREADAEVCEMIDFCRFYALQAERLAVGARVDLPGEINETIYDPRGVAVVIAPWNFPLAILGGMAVAALVTGNPVVLKPAEQAPIIAHALWCHLLAAGIPPEVVHYLPGYGEELGPILVDHPATALIAFTGSRAVGLGLNRRAAEVLAVRDHVVLVIAEMGGKNAIIVDASADLDEAVAGVVASAFGYQGQKCSACSRVIVDSSLYEAFVQRLIEAVRALELGPAEDAGHLLGPVIDDEARSRLESQCAELATRHRLAYAGDAAQWAAQGSFVAPHVFVDVEPGSWLAQEELFGPVLAVIRAADLADSMRIANGTRYALTGGCFARSPAVLAQVRREFRVGNLYLNRGSTGALVERQPFGGFKLSGIGSKAGGPDYLLQFVVPRTISENTLRHGMVVERE